MKIARHGLLLAALAALGAPCHADGLHFKLKFVVLVPGMDMPAVEEAVQKELARLNSAFSFTSSVKFELKSIVAHQDTQTSTCELAKHGTRAQPYNFRVWASLMAACDDPRLKHDGDIPVYLFDAYSDKNGFSEQNSHARLNGHRPVVFIDHERLLNGAQNPLVHEMGHAFGLGHICAVGASRRSPTNPMASADCGKGSGGMRNAAFNSDQQATIRRNAKLTHASFAGGSERKMKANETSSGGR